MIAEEKSMSEAEMIANVKHSTESALTALKYFQQSLIRARMSESSHSYRTMCDTLIGQRIWMLNKHDNDVENNFDELSVVAQDIVQILKPYVNSFEKLISLDVGSDKVDKAKTESEIKISKKAGSTKNDLIVQNIKKATIEEAVLDIVKQNNGKVSFTKLRNLTKLRKKDLDELLAVMLSKNILAEKKISGRRIIVLK